MARDIRFSEDDYSRDTRGRKSDDVEEIFIRERERSRPRYALNDIDIREREHNLQARERELRREFGEDYRRPPPPPSERYAYHRVEEAAPIRVRPSGETETRVVNPQRRRADDYYEEEITINRRPDRSVLDARKWLPDDPNMSQQRIATAFRPHYMRVNPVKRKFGPVEFQRFDHLVASEANIGSGTLDKVNISCKLLFSRTRWGTLGAGSSQFPSHVPAGIMYMDLTFDQPKDCKLVSANVTVTLNDEGRELESFRNSLKKSEETTVVRRTYVVETLGPPVQITNLYGPKAITGKERTKEQRSGFKADLTPGFAEATLGGLGYHNESTKILPSRWMFSGQTIPGGDGHRARSGFGTDYLYRGVRWTLTENDLEPQASHCATIHTAFAFVHGTKPVIMKVEVNGRLRGRGTRAKNRILEFPRTLRGKDNTTSTLINLSDQRAFVLPLDEQAQGLELEMQMANIASNPVEMPEPMPATFSSISPSPSKSTATLKDDIQADHKKEPNLRDPERYRRFGEGSGPTTEDLIKAFKEATTAPEKRLWYNGFFHSLLDEVESTDEKEKEKPSDDHTKENRHTNGSALEGKSKADGSVAKTSLNKDLDSASMHPNWVLVMAFWHWAVWLFAGVVPGGKKRVANTPNL